MPRADLYRRDVALIRAPRDPAPTNRRTLICAAALLLTGAAKATPAGSDLRIDWTTIDAGGGTASGGSFAVSGTIGQIDVDPLQPASGGSFVLTGGFWVVDGAPSSDLLFRSGFEGP